MDKKEKHIKDCINTVAAMDVSSEYEAIAKKTVLSTLEELQQEKKSLIKYLKYQIKETGIDENNITIEGDYNSLEEFKSRVVAITTYMTLKFVLESVKSDKYERK